MSRFPLVIFITCGSILGAAPAMEVETLPDPTRPPAAHNSAVRKLNQDQPRQFLVSAIKITAARKTAIVNGRLVAEGDTLAGAEVVEIRPSSVIVEFLSERREISLLSWTVRQKSSQP